ncbi:MAG: MBL fold metallo-hydrolase [Rubrobacteraceae bacterium]|nr:MBL fold metallo-hydrolase [Rubrobacteraceae bacterium]
MPIPLRFVSAYLIESPEGWTLLDTGFDYPDGRAAWEAGASSLGLDLRDDVSRILVSHFHPDHLGAARWLQGLSGAPVHMLGDEIEHSRFVWEDDGEGATLAENLVLNGMPSDLAERAGSGMRTNLHLPEKMLPLRADEEIQLGGSAARVIHAPGHADYQYMLHDESRGILFAADHVLLKITPNIGLWPESLPHPLARYLKSLSGMRGMNADLVLPGHGPVFHDLDGRIEELLSHHEERLEVMYRELEPGPKTPFEVSGAVFRETLTLYEHCFALAETLAHLDHLALEGRAERIENERVTFQAA